MTNSNEAKSGAEQWYDVEIAPALLMLASRCRGAGIAMVAAVEFEPGKRGVTSALPESSGLAMHMLQLCAAAGENVDGYVIGLIRYCAANNIDTSQSFVLDRWAA